MPNNDNPAAAAPRTITASVCAWIYPHDRDPHLANKADADWCSWQRMSFDPAAPLEVEFLGCYFGRELLGMALGGRCAGDPAGDVHVHREGRDLRITVRSDIGDTSMWLPAAVVEEFLARTFVVVPAEQEAERLDWVGFLTGESA